MKRIGKWLLGLITSALTLVLVIVLLPYAAKWVARMMPDESAAANRESVELSQELQQSAARDARRHRAAQEPLRTGLSPGMTTMWALVNKLSKD